MTEEMLDEIEQRAGQFDAFSLGMLLL